MHKIAKVVTFFVAGTTPILANADTAEISASLQFDGGSDEATQLMDDFQNMLQAMDGQVIWLDLSLLNKETELGDNTYSVSHDADEEVSGDAFSDKIVCGRSGKIGLIDNGNYGYVVGFNRPADYHGPTTIRIGDRRNFPRHSIKCGLEDHTSENETALHIRGYFVVEVSAIPTAITYDLFPISSGD